LGDRGRGRERAVKREEERKKGRAIRKTGYGANDLGVKFDAKIYSVKLGAKIYGAKVAAKSPSRLRRRLRQPKT